MMFMLNSSLSLQIIALTFAAFLFSWGLHKEGKGTGIAKFIGFITTIIALFSLVSSLYFAVKFWQDSQMLRPFLHSPAPSHETQSLSNSAPSAAPSAATPAETTKKK